MTENNCSRVRFPSDVLGAVGLVGDEPVRFVRHRRNEWISGAYEWFYDTLYGTKSYSGGSVKD